MCIRDADKTRLLSHDPSKERTLVSSWVDWCTVEWQANRTGGTSGPVRSLVGLGYFCKKEVLLGKRKTMPSGLEVCRGWVHGYISHRTQCFHLKLARS